MPCHSQWKSTTLTDSSQRWDMRWIILAVAPEEPGFTHPGPQQRRPSFPIASRPSAARMPGAHSVTVESQCSHSCGTARPNHCFLLFPTQTFRHGSNYLVATQTIQNWCWTYRTRVPTVHSHLKDSHTRQLSREAPLEETSELGSQTHAKRE